MKSRRIPGCCFPSALQLLLSRAAIKLSPVTGLDWCQRLPIDNCSEYTQALGRSNAKNFTLKRGKKMAFWIPFWGYFFYSFVCFVHLSHHGRTCRGKQAGASLCTNMFGVDVVFVICKPNLTAGCQQECPGC